MALINRVPQGLLGLLDLKAQGENPAQLAPFVQATFELRDLYALNTRECLSQAVAVGALGAVNSLFTALLVPQGELWLLTNLTASQSAPPLPAAATIAYAAGVFPADASSRFLGLAPVMPTASVGLDYLTTWDGQVILRPGDQLGIWVTTFSGAPGGCRVSAQRSRFLI